jgi:hypothetical protein
MPPKCTSDNTFNPLDPLKHNKLQQNTEIQVIKGGASGDLTVVILAAHIPDIIRLQFFV